METKVITPRAEEERLKKLAMEWERVEMEKKTIEEERLRSQQAVKKRVDIAIGPDEAMETKSEVQYSTWTETRVIETPAISTTEQQTDNKQVRFSISQEPVKTQVSVPKIDEEDEEVWEVLVSSDQNSWKTVAQETLPSSVVRKTSLSTLEHQVKEKLSAETQKVLDEAEEVRFSEEVVKTVVQNEVKDTLTQRHHSVANVWTDAGGSPGGLSALGANRTRSHSMLPASSYHGGSSSSLLSPNSAAEVSSSYTRTRQRSGSREYSPSPYRVSLSIP